MTNEKIKAAACLAALAVCACLAAPAAADSIEAVAVSARTDGGQQAAFKDWQEVKAAIKKTALKVGREIAKIPGRIEKLPGVPNRGVYGRDHCEPYGGIPTDGGDSGWYCRSEKPATVSCEITGWRDEVDGEMGVVRRPILGKCTSSWGGQGGWAGDKPADPGLQSP